MATLTRTHRFNFVHLELKGSFLPGWWQKSICLSGLRDQTLSRNKDQEMLQCTFPGDRIKHKLLFSAYQSTAAYHCENITYYKVSWGTSRSVKSVLRHFSTIFSGTCSEHSRCGERLQNSAWALKSSAGCPPVIALKRAQRVKEKRKWLKTLFSLILGHWQAIVGLLVYFL